MSSYLTNRFNTLQQALRELNYTESLVPDAVPLVESVFSDLVDVTRRYQQMKQESEQSRRAQSAATRQIAPLQSEVERLIQENLALQGKIIGQGESHDEELQRMRKEVEKFRSSQEETQFMLNQKSHKIKSQEFDLTNLKRKLSSLQKRHKMATTNLVGKKSPLSSESVSDAPSDIDDAAFKHTSSLYEEKIDLLEKERQRLQELVEDVRNEAFVHENKISSLEDSLRARDDELKRLRNREWSGSFDHSTTSFPMTQGGSAGDVGRTSQIDLGAIERRYGERTSDEMIEHLNAQVELLQNELTQFELKMEAKSKESEKVVSENSSLKSSLDIAWKEMEGLQDELKKVKKSDRKRKRGGTQGSSKTTTRDSNPHEEVAAVKMQLERVREQKSELQSRLEDLKEDNKKLSAVYESYQQDKQSLADILQSKENQLTNYRETNAQVMKERDDLHREVIQLQNQVASYMSKSGDIESDLSMHQETIASLQMAKVKLTEHIEQLQHNLQMNEHVTNALQTDNEQLVLQLEKKSKRVDELNTELVGSIQSKTVLETEKSRVSSTQIELQSMIQHLEEERTELRNQHEIQVQACEEQQEEISRLKSEIQTLNFNLKTTREHIEDMVVERRDLREQILSKEKRISEFEGNLKHADKLFQENAVLKSKANLTTEQTNDLQLKYQKLARDFEQQKNMLEQLRNERGRRQEHLDRTEKERDQLSNLLSDFEERVSSLQSRLELVTTDRDHISGLHRQLQSEARNTTSNMEVACQEKEDALRKLQKFEDRCQTLQQEVVATREISDEQKKMIRESMSKIESFDRIQTDLSKRIQVETVNKQRLFEECEALNRTKKQLETDNVHLNTELEKETQKTLKVMQDKRVEQAKVVELKTLCNQLDVSRLNSEKRIQELYQENQKISSECERLKGLIENVGRERQEGDGTIAKLRHALTEQANNMDRLQNELDTKTEMIHSLEQARKNSEVDQGKMNCMVAESQQHLRSQQQVIAQKQQQIDSLVKQVETLTNKMQEMKEQIHLQAARIQAASNDMDNMAKENQFLNREFAQSVSERDTKAQELERALSKLLWLEEKLKIEDKEKQGILSTYQAVCSENERVRVSVEQLDSERSQSRVEIATLRDQMARRDQRIQELEGQIAQNTMDLHVLQRQNQNLVRNLEKSHHSVSAQKQKTASLAQDLEAARHSAKYTEQFSERHTRDLALLRESSQDIHNQLAQTEIEKHIAEEKLQSVVQKANRLEGIIANMRTEHVHLNENYTQKEAEAGKLQDELEQMRKLNERLQSQVASLSVGGR